MNEVKDLEQILSAMCETLGWNAVMTYTHGKLTGIGMGTPQYLSETLDISLSVWDKKHPRPTLHLVKD